MARTPFAHIVVIFSFIINSFIPVPLALSQEFYLPKAGSLIHLSPALNPPILKGLKIHPDNPLRFEFIMDRGDKFGRHPEPSEGSEGALRSFGFQPQDDVQLKQESTRLIKYFLASLTIPEQDLWVNLSPYEKNRIIPQSFGQTEMGRDLLAEDYLLKQVTASLIYPEDNVGKKFWKRVYEEAAKKFGTTNIPVNTFNKVWIVPQKAVVYENTKAGTVYVVESTLKVMLEEDYLAMKKKLPPTEESKGALRSFAAKRAPQDDKGISFLGSQIIREIIIPELTREVNQGSNFAQLRQVYNSLILALWYKRKIKQSILAQVYEDKNKIKGTGYRHSVILSETKDLKGPKDSSALPQNDTELIYRRYLQAFKKGAYNYIKEEHDPLTQETVPRKYFSGGVLLANFAMISMSRLPSNIDQQAEGSFQVTADFNPAMNASTASIKISHIYDRDFINELFAYHRVNENDWTDEVYLLAKNFITKNIKFFLDPKVFKNGGYQRLFGFIGNNKIQINTDFLLAFTFLIWINENGPQRGNVQEERKLFWSIHNHLRSETIKFLFDEFKRKHGVFPQDYQIEHQAFVDDKEAQMLLRYQIQHGLLDLRQFGYGELDEENFVDVKSEEGFFDPHKINIAIHYRNQRDIIEFARQASFDPDVNVIFLPWPDELETKFTNNKLTPFAMSGVVFKDGRPYYVEFSKPVIFDYVATFDPKKNYILNVAGVPTFAHRLIDDFIELKDITGSVLRVENSLHVNSPTYMLLLSSVGQHKKLSEDAAHRRVIEKRNGNIKAIDPKDGYYNQIGAYLREFLNRRDAVTGEKITKGVIKPNEGSGGKGVFYFSESNLDDAIHHAWELLEVGQDVLVQEEIISIGKEISFNARVLVSFDDNGNPIVLDEDRQLARVGKAGDVINVARGAKYDRLENAIREALKAEGVDPADIDKQVTEIKEEIFTQAKRSVQKIHQAMGGGFEASGARLNKNWKKGDTSSDLYGVDIIVTRAGKGRFKAYVLELNGILSGGGYTIARLYKEDSQKPNQWAGLLLARMKQRAVKARAVNDSAMRSLGSETVLGHQSAMLEVEELFRDGKITQRKRDDFKIINGDRWLTDEGRWLFVYFIQTHGIENLMGNFIKGKDKANKNGVLGELSIAYQMVSRGYEILTLGFHCYVDPFRIEIDAILKSPEGGLVFLESKTYRGDSDENKIYQWFMERIDRSGSSSVFDRFNKLVQVLRSDDKILVNKYKEAMKRSFPKDGFVGFPEFLDFLKDKNSRFRFIIGLAVNDKTFEFIKRVLAKRINQSGFVREQRRKYDFEITAWVSPFYGIRGFKNEDAAQIAKEMNGGIDLSQANMKLKVAPPQAGDKGDIRFHIDPAMLKQLQDASGLVPVVVNVKPIRDLQVFLTVSS